MNHSKSQYPLYIFDLDGTLALIDHRRPMLATANKNKDFKAFNALCVKDVPNWPVIGTFLQLYSVGCDVRIWSARDSEVRPQTLEWLCAYTGMQPYAIDRILTMRPEGDSTPDEALKKKWLHLLTPQERGRLAAVFDDRNKVVDMWRANGVTCFQVAPGDF